MAQVTLLYRAALAEKTGLAHERIEAATVHDVLAYIKKTHGIDAYRQAKRMLIAVDNDSILLHKGFDTPLADGMAVRFLPVCAGG